MEVLKELLIREREDVSLEYGTKNLLQTIVDGCVVCKEKSVTYRLFKLTLGMNDLRFNRTVKFGTMLTVN